jgi:glycosyltransferase involved in cell wall biosynthesis
MPATNGALTPLCICMLSTDYLPNPGGVAAHVQGLSRALTGLGHTVYIVTKAQEDYLPGLQVEDGLPVLRAQLPRSKGTGKLSQMMLAATSLSKRLLTRVPRECMGLRESWLGIPLLQLHRQVGFDVVHFHGLEPDATASRWVRDAACVFTNHTSMFISAVEHGDGPIVWRGLAHADRFLAPSQELADLTVQIGAPADRVVNLANGVDAETFSPRDSHEVRAALGYSDDEVVVFTARRLVEKNGVRYLVEAGGQFLKDNPHARLLIAGDGPERASLESLAQELGITSRVRFLGNMERAQLPGLTNAVDLVVLPSLKEATSIAGLEAMACAKPLVGTRVGGIPEILAEGETGLLVPPCDAGSLAGAIQRLCRDQELRTRLGQAARRRVEAEFSWTAVAHRTVAEYEKALRAHKVITGVRA